MCPVGQYQPQTSLNAFAFRTTTCRVPAAGQYFVNNYPGNGVLASFGAVWCGGGYVQASTGATACTSCPVYVCSPPTNPALCCAVRCCADGC